jgi:hypothetical protein
MASENVRLAHAAEQRKHLKEDTTKFGDLFWVFIEQFEEEEDNISLRLREMMTDLKNHDFNQLVLQKSGKTRAAPPTDAEKLLRPKEYARCEHCEKVIQKRLMKLHQGRAICLETAKTRFTDVKLVKASKDKTEMPRFRVKERMALMAEYNALDEKTIVETIRNHGSVKLDPMKMEKAAKNDVRAVVVVGCRDMTKCLPNGTHIRTNTPLVVTQLTGKYNSFADLKKTRVSHRKVINFEGKMYSLNQFNLLPRKRERPDIIKSADAWRECECKLDGVWLSMENLSEM